MSQGLRRRLSPLRDFVATESAGAILIAIGAVAALGWANSPWRGSYESFWTHRISLGIGFDLRHWLNEALMTLFFLVVGLEISREIVDGHLSTRRSALLPMVGAVGGMLLPALIYLAIAGGDAPRGWAIPMATDIALAVGVLAVAGSRLPTSLRAFLLGLAIVDDIGAIVIIAAIYSTGLLWGWLAAALATIVAVVVVRRFGPRAIALYVLLGIVVWVALYKAGVYPTLAGVAVGLLVPHAPAERLERAVHPWSSYVIVPLFALANAGIVISAAGLHEAVRSSVAWGVFAGLLLGKPIGVLVASKLAARVGIANLPAGTSRMQLFGVGTAAGIGFTVAIFITELALTDPTQRSDAKLAILAASVVAAASSGVLLRFSARASTPYSRHRARRELR